MKPPLYTKNVPSRLLFPVKPVVIVLLVLIQFFSTAWSATLKEITDFGYNPAKLKMFLYVPDNVKPRPAILVGLHWCHGTAQAYFNGNQYHTFADQYGFIMVCPGTYSSDSCFDVHSTGALTHNGGSDPGSIVSMIKYVIQNNNGDSTRVFVTGHSGGGMMTNVMAGSYPEVFRAASGSATVPFACFAGGSYTWNDDCAKGRVTKTPQEWGDLVRTAYPGYTGPRPKIQLWHGANDNVLYPVNFDEAIEQWTNVLGISQTPVSTELNTPMSNYTRTRYADNTGTVLVEAIKGLNQPHNIQLSEAEVIRFFGLDKSVAVNDNIGPGGDCSRFNKTALFVRKISPDCLVFSVSSTPGWMGIELYDLGGKKVATVANKYSASGRFEIIWRGNGSSLPLLSAATYILSIKINGASSGLSRIIAVSRQK